MSASRTRIDRATAERLLSGGSVDPQHRRLAELISAMAVIDVPGSGASQDVPLPGEAAVMTAFRAAHRNSPRQRRRSVIAKLLTMKVALGVTTAVAAGGVALAASNGTLPNPLADQAKPQASAAADDKEHGDHGKGSPSPSLEGLCKAFNAKVGKNEHGKALESPAFQALVTAAGGKDKVTSYCEDLLASAKGKKGSAPESRPSNAPTARPERPEAPTAPTGAPAAPTDHPTGAPTSRPTH